jgi:hypothetical protein
MVGKKTPVTYAKATKPKTKPDTNKLKPKEEKKTGPIIPKLTRKAKEIPAELMMTNYVVILDHTNK